MESIYKSINFFNEIKIELENEDLTRYDAEFVLQSLKNFIREDR